MDLELISFKICPFVQRAVITLLYKKIPFRITHIDLSDPPEWFKEISPFGKTPVLRVDKKHSIFESAVIDEYLDEITPGRMLPSDPLQRALDRSWILFGESMLMHVSGIINGSTREKYEDNLASLTAELAWLETMLGSGPWFNGEQISLVDFAYGPLFMRIDFLGLDKILFSDGKFPKIRQWAHSLLEDLPATRESVVPEFKELLCNVIRKKGQYSAEVLQLYKQ